MVPAVTAKVITPDDCDGLVGDRVGDRVSRVGDRVGVWGVGVGADTGDPPTHRPPNVTANPSNTLPVDIPKPSMHSSA